MDVLSEVLRAVRLEGALFFNAEFSAPWSISSSPSASIAPYLSPGAGHLIIYHFLTEGRAYARLTEGRREELTAGDIVIFPHGDAHVLGNGSPERPVESLQTFAKNLSHGLKLARFGGGGEVTRFVCGFMACEPRLSEVFLAGLPKMLKVHVANEPSGQWLENSIRFSVGEANGSNAGGGLVLAKLSEVLFVETLRRYINALPPDQTGWLAGARDPIIGQALALLHKDPTDPWTIANLARRVGLSRTRLAERFRHFLGESPMAYLAKWRLKLGAELLLSTEDSVAGVAVAVGYGSEAAFNRAFKREFDCPPAQFRRKRKAPPAQRSPQR
ncbi:MAG TPA: AraC family transcriptional regulator [Blastocatellia bacterium]|nr:AraC family transcriptional regulator [Blastocatellia bacterium]